jgi:hypothetical protein
MNARDKRRIIIGLTAGAALMAVTTAIIHLIEFNKLFRGEFESWGADFAEPTLAQRDFRVAFALIFTLLALGSRWAAGMALALPGACFAYRWVYNPNIGLRTDIWLNVIVFAAIVAAFVLLKLRATDRSLSTLAMFYILLEYVLWGVRSYNFRQHPVSEDPHYVQPGLLYLADADWWNIATLVMCLLLVAAHLRGLAVNRSTPDAM